MRYTGCVLGVLKAESYEEIAKGKDFKGSLKADFYSALGFMFLKIFILA